MSAASASAAAAASIAASAPEAGAGVRLTTPQQAARTFHRLRWRLICNTVRSLLAGSRLRMAMILVCSGIFWVVLFGLFYAGFQFIHIYDSDLKDALIEYL